MKFHTSELNIIKFTKEHHQAAAALIIERYREGRKDNPLWPDKYRKAEDVLPFFGYKPEEQMGVAAVRGGEAVGFMVGFPWDNFGVPVAWVPDFGNGAIAVGRGYIYRRMYAELAQRWVERGYLRHAFFAFAHEREVLDALFATGFNMSGLDAMRDLKPVPAPDNGVKIRRAVLDDTGVLMELRRKLGAHLRQSPVFQYLPDTAVEAGEEQFRRQIEEGKTVIFLAEEKGRTIGAMRAGPPSIEEFKMPVFDEKTCAISMAFIEQDRRGRGIADALLNRILGWAKETGCVRCTVDFESGNIPASGFWLKHFKPVVYHLARFVEERAYRYLKSEAPDGK